MRTIGPNGGAVAVNKESGRVLSSSGRLLPRWVADLFFARVVDALEAKGIEFIEHGVRLAKKPHR